MGKIALIGLGFLIVLSLFMLNYLPQSFESFRVIFELLPFIFTFLFLGKLVMDIYNTKL